MLRSELQSVGAELIEAKSRISELEARQSLDREALQASGKLLSDASKSMVSYIVKSSLTLLQHNKVGMCWKNSNPSKASYKLPF